VALQVREHGRGGVVEHRGFEVARAGICRVKRRPHKDERFGYLAGWGERSRLRPIVRLRSRHGDTAQVGRTGWGLDTRAAELELKESQQLTERAEQQTEVRYLLAASAPSTAAYEARCGNA
jgi:hypothetical protein